MGRTVVASLGALAVALAVMAGGSASAAQPSAHPYKGYSVGVRESEATPGETLNSAGCSSGGTLVGGGVVLDDSDLADNVSTSGPAGGGSTWSVQVDNETSNQATVDVYVICVTNFISRYSIVSDTADSLAGAQTKVSASCPAKTVVIDGGIDANSSDLPASLTLNSSFPYRHTGWIATINNASPDDASVTAFAICAKRPPGYIVEVGPSEPIAPGSQMGAQADCPHTMDVLGGGGSSSSNSTDVSISSTYPYGHEAWLIYDNNRTSTATSLVSYAICAKATS